MLINLWFALGNGNFEISFGEIHFTWLDFLGIGLPLLYIQWYESKDIEKWEYWCLIVDIKDFNSTATPISS